MACWIVGCLVIIIPTSVQAALQSDTYWEIRPAGNDANGGCYDNGGTGTDYTQQDSAQLSITDGATSGAGSTTLTSASAGFTSAMVDNCIHITAGTNFTVGFYEITAFTNSSTVTLDRTPTASGAGSGGTGGIGGALLTLSAIPGNGSSVNNFVYVKGGTYTETLTLASTNDPGQWRCYKTTRGDELTLATTDRCVIDGQSTRANGINITSNTNRIWIGWKIVDATGACITGTTGNNIIQNSRLTSCGGNGLDGTNVSFYNSEIDNNTLLGVSRNLFSGVNYSYVHDNGGVGIDNSSILFSILDTNGDDGVELNHGEHVINSVAYGNSGASADGFAFNSNSQFSTNYYLNNVSVSNGNCGWNNEAQGAVSANVVFDYNLYANNSGGTICGSGWQFPSAGGSNDVTTDPGMNAPATGDFTYTSSSSSAVDAGFPGTMPGATGNYSWNIGLDQGDHVVGGGAGGWGF